MLCYKKGQLIVYQYQIYTIIELDDRIENAVYITNHTGLILHVLASHIQPLDTRPLTYMTLKQKSALYFCEKYCVTTFEGKTMGELSLFLHHHLKDAKYQYNRRFYIDD